MNRQARCACGQLSVTIGEGKGEGTGEEPLRVSICHCHDCQRRTGSVFGVQARFHTAAVTRKGKSTVFTRVGDEGTKIHLSFCPECGSTVFYQYDDLPEFTAIPVGAFADNTFTPPMISIYETRMHPWVTLPDNIEHMK